MQKLRLLQLDYVQFTGDYEHLSKELRWLRWHGFPQKFMPNNFYSRNLVAIDLRYSNLTQVWKNSKQLFEKLKFLNLSHSHCLTQTPNFARLPNLEKLILKNCTSLFEVHQSIGDLSNLVMVNLRDCRNLESLPRSFYKLKSLQTLILSGCSKFDNLADEIGEMGESLTTFLADNTAIRQVPWTIVQLKNLKELSLCGCKGSLSKSLPSLFWSWISPRKSPISLNLPASLQGLNSLTVLCLSDCNLLDDAIPKDLGSLPSLEDLDLRENHFYGLPLSFGGLSKLESLDLNGCTKLQSIPDLPQNLNFLGAENCMALERMPNMSNMSNMEFLFLSNCKKLVEIPGLDKLLKSLIFIEMLGCNNLTNSFKQSILQEWPLSGFSVASGICLPGNDIPNWFTYKDEGSSVCFEVPHNITDGNFEGFTICIVFSRYPSKENVIYFPTNSITVVNSTKSTTQSKIPVKIHPALITYDVEDHIWQNNIPKRFFNTSNLEAGDKVEVTADFDCEFVVKKIGVHLIDGRVIDGKMIRYASTSSKDAIVVGDDGDVLTIDQAAIKSKRGLGDDEAGSSHGCLDNEREAKKLRCEHYADDEAKSSHGCFVNDQEARRLRFDHNSEMIMDDD